MSNSSPEFWSVADLDGQNEVSLHQWGWAVTTVGGSRYDLPPKRGSDMVMPYRPGQVHRRKLPDARTVSLNMFMVGWDPATGDAPADQLLQWNVNWDTLRRLVYRHSQLPDQRVRLIRRWFLTTDDTLPPQYAAPTGGKRLVKAFAQAEMTGQMQPSMTGRYRAEFQMDFTLSDPFFYGDQRQVTLAPNTPLYVWNDGHDVAGPEWLTLDLVGPLDSPRFYNLSTDPDSWVGYNANIAAGETVQLRVYNYTCEQILASGNKNKIAYVTSYGASFWITLLPGPNQVRLTSFGGNGHAVLKYRSPYV